MKISSLRIGAGLVLVVQWAAVIVVMLACRRYGKIFADFDVALPTLTWVVLQLAQPWLLASIAALTTLIVVAADIWLKSENARLGILMADLCFWIAFACFSIIVVLVSFANLIAKLST
jgi:hypothetical protein